VTSCPSSSGQSTGCTYTLLHSLHVPPSGRICTEYIHVHVASLPTSLGQSTYMLLHPSGRVHTRCFIPHLPRAEYCTRCFIPHLPRAEYCTRCFIPHLPRAEYAHVASSPTSNFNSTDWNKRGRSSPLSQLVGCFQRQLSGPPEKLEIDHSYLLVLERRRYMQPTYSF